MNVIHRFMFEANKGFSATEKELRIYEVSEGDYVRVKHGSSANPYWHTRADYDESEWLQEGNPGANIIAEARLYVSSPDAGVTSYVGHWNTLDEVREFIKLYMRGVTIDEEEA